MSGATGQEYLEVHMVAPLELAGVLSISLSIYVHTSRVRIRRLRMDF